MAITDNESAFVDSTAESIALSQMFTLTAGSTDPTYLVLTVLDRDEYTAGASGATGTPDRQRPDACPQQHRRRRAGHRNRLHLPGIHRPSYYNSTYGYLNQLTYNSSSSAGDVTNLSLFGTNNLSLANAYATNAVAMMEEDPSGYLGSATVVTRPGYTATVPTQATPDSIASAADSFVGQAWNMDGCWVLASTIAAEAGASLPVQSTLVGLPGAANGEWIVAFDGPAGQTGNWENMVTAGEMIVIETAGGGGHITTCVSGSGSTAMLVDNVTFVNGSGQVLNPANDGSSADIIIAAPHAASQEFAGVAASTVVIYELDTPIVTADCRVRPVSRCLRRNRWARCFPRPIPPTRRSPPGRSTIRRPATRWCLAAPITATIPPPTALTASIARLDIPARRLDRDDRHAGGAGVQRQLLGRLGVAERDDRRDRPAPPSTARFWKRRRRTRPGSAGRRSRWRCPRPPSRTRRARR